MRVPRIRARARAFSYSLSGLKVAFGHERAFRQELLLAALLIPVALLFAHGFVEQAVHIGSVAAVLVTELLNSAVEAAVDRVSLEDHEYAKRAKDIASAAVLVSLLTCALVWILFLADRAL